MKSNQKYVAKYSSHLLISTLIASSFFMVNCNKGQNRAGVKANTTSGTPAEPISKSTSNSGDTSKVGSGDDTKAVKEVVADCPSPVFKSYAAVATEAVRVEDLYKKNKTAASPEKLKSDYLKVLALCTDMGKEFDQVSLKSCKYKNPKNKNEDVVINKATTQCLIVAKQLDDEDGTKTEFLKLYNDQKELKKQDLEKQLSSFENFKAAKLVMSDDMKKMLKPDNLNFKMYIVGGEIKTDQAEMKKAYADKKVVCSFVGTSTEISEKGKSIFSALEVENVDKKDLPENINAVGIAFSVSTGEKSDGISAGISNMQMLGCSHLLKDRIDVKLLRQALGAQLATEADIKKIEDKKSEDKKVEDKKIADKKAEDGKVAAAKLEADKKIAADKKIEEDKKTASVATEK